MFKPAVQPSGELPRVAAVSKGIGPEQGEPLEPRSMWQVDVRDETRLSANPLRFTLSVTALIRPSGEPWTGGDIVQTPTKLRALLTKNAPTWSRWTGYDAYSWLGRPPASPKGLWLPSLQFARGRMMQVRTGRRVGR